jgi:hypothetical protein
MATLIAERGRHGRPCELSARQNAPRAKYWQQKPSRAEIPREDASPPKCRAANRSRAKILRAEVQAPISSRADILAADDAGASSSRRDPSPASCSGWNAWNGSKSLSSVRGDVNS